MFTPSEWKELITLIEEFEPVRKQLYDFLVKMEDQWNEEWGELPGGEMTEWEANELRRIYAIGGWREDVGIGEIILNEYEKWVL